MFRKKTKPSNCKIGRPCGLGCVPKSHNCKSVLKGAAKTLVQWLSNVTLKGVKKVKESVKQSGAKLKSLRDEITGEADFRRLQEIHQKNMVEREIELKRASEERSKRNEESRNLEGESIDDEQVRQLFLGLDEIHSRYAKRQSESRIEFEAEMSRLKQERIRKERERIEKERIEKERIEKELAHEEYVKNRNDRAKSFHGLRTSVIEDFVFAGATESSGRPLKNTIRSAVIGQSVFMDKANLITAAVDDYVSTHGGKKDVYLRKIQKFETGQVVYAVNGRHDRIKPGRTDEDGRTYKREDLYRIGSKAFRMMKSQIKAVPDGAIFHCLAYSDDGSGGYRREIYEKIGFGNPIEELGNNQFAIKRNGNLYPLTKSQLFTEIIESEQK